MSVLEETKFLMKKYKIKANKNLGQNFLIDDTVIEDIVNGADIKKDDLVIEIGPGLGSMTALLVKKAKKVICVELDKKMIKILNDRFIAYNNIELINEDVLKLDLNKLIKQEKEQNEIKEVKIVANLPYYITTPIIMKLLEENLDIQSITVMIQKEVADRLIETPGGKNTGAITYTVYYYCESEKIMEVPNSSFIPEQEVTSEVIKMTLRNKPAVDIENTKVFMSKQEGIEILKKLNLDENVRAENLTLQDFANIAKIICK